MLMSDLPFFIFFPFPKTSGMTGMKYQAELAVNQSLQAVVPARERKKVLAIGHRPK